MSFSIRELSFMKYQLKKRSDYLQRQIDDEDRHQKYHYDIIEIDCVVNEITDKLRRLRNEFNESRGYK